MTEKWGEKKGKPFGLVILFNFLRLLGYIYTNIPLGKDYSNERVVEFHTLNKPEEDMYDRTKVPRMPW